MKKQGGLLLLSLGLVLILAGAVYYLTQYNTEENPPAIPLTEHSASDIAQVVLKQGSQSLTVVKTQEGYEIPALTKKNMGVNPTVCASLYEAVGKLRYHEIITENPENKSQYGLENPVVSAEVTLQNGGTYTVCVGNSYYDGNGIYFSLSGDAKIYGTIFNNAFDALQQKENDFLEKVIFADTKGTAIGDFAFIEWVKDGATHRVEKETVENIDHFMLQRPLQLELEYGQVQELFTPLLQLHATHITSLNLPQAQKSQYGFTGNNKLTYRLKEKTYTLEIGNKTTIGYYVLTENNVCYFVPATSLEFYEYQFKSE